MPLSAGVYTRLYNWLADRNNSINIMAERMDAEFDAVGTAISTAIMKDGQTTVTADIPFNNKLITGLGDATAATHAMNRQTADERYKTNAAITGGTIDNVSIGATTKASSVNATRYTSDAAAGQTQIAYAGVAETISKAMLWLRARISGDVTTADASFPARIAPFKMSVTDAARSTSGVPVSAFHVLHIASGSGTTTGTDYTRESCSFRLQVEGQYGATGYMAFTPFQTISYSSSTQGGAGGWSAGAPFDPSYYHRGEMFGGCVTTWVANGATNFMGCTGFEVNWAVHTGGSVGRKVGLALIKDTSDAVAGTVMDAGIEISSKTASVAPIGIGIQFGNPVGFWAFDNTSTLIGSKRRGQDISAVSGPEATVAANYGVDFREVTFTTGAFASTGFAVDPVGRVSSPGVTHAAKTFATLPTASAGMTAYITDCNTNTWGATAAGGGSNKVLLWYNGTNWTVAGK